MSKQMHPSLASCPYVIFAIASQASADMGLHNARRIINSSYSFPPNVRVSDEAKRLIQSMLVVDPKERITIAQICEDPWFK